MFCRFLRPRGNKLLWICFLISPTSRPVHRIGELRFFSSAIVPLLVSGADVAATSATILGQPLDLSPFEDDDCLEVDNADVLLILMNDMAVVLERIPKGAEPADQDESVEYLDAFHDTDPAWAGFDSWMAANEAAMTLLAASVLGRPYCEPGKLAWVASQCLFTLRRGSDGHANALECASMLDEDLLLQITPVSTSYSTRLNLVLRSPWPALRLLDLLVRLHPEHGSTRMGACRAYRNWASESDVLDWPWFKRLLPTVVDSLSAETPLFELRPTDGPLSAQYRARWMRVFAWAGLKDVLEFSDAVFEKYKEHHYQAGCHVGVISSYVLQLLPLLLRDSEGRLQRVASSVAQLTNLHAPFSHLVKTEWPLFRLLYVLNLLQRSPPGSAWRSDLASSRSGVRAPPAGPSPSGRSGAAKMLCDSVQKAATGRIAYVTAAWGHLAAFAGPVMRRWRSLLQKHQEEATLILLAVDSEAATACDEESVRAASAVHCIVAPARLGVEGVIAKYLALAAVAQLGVIALWLDLDVYVLSDPSSAIRQALADPSTPDLVFARNHMSESLVPAVVLARPSDRAVEILLWYAYWLRDNPYLLDHQGWDPFLEHKAGDFYLSNDYKGRDVSVKDPAGRPGPRFSFLPMMNISSASIPGSFSSFGETSALVGGGNGSVYPKARFSIFGEEYGSGDGIGRRPHANSLIFFHFWGAEETQAQLFNLFYPLDSSGTSEVPENALELLDKYRREMSEDPQLSALLKLGGGGQPLYSVAISYADGCCQKSLKKNMQAALAVGCDEARAYTRGDLDLDWAAKNEKVLSQRRGGGWWLWKPHIILKTLRDPAVPWGLGVVLWTDAGNYLHADPRPVLAKALWGSDVVALRLKLCLEADWTSAVTLRRMGVVDRYSIVDRPQLGAYFLAFRKTGLSIRFVEEWLRLSEDADTLLGSSSANASGTAEQPNFQVHQADQSVFSVLFKAYGFRPMSLEEGHTVVTLARWRE